MKTIPLSARLKRWKTLQSRSNLRKHRPKEGPCYAARGKKGCPCCDAQQQLEEEIGEMIELVSMLVKDRHRLLRIEEEHERVSVAMVNYHLTEEAYMAEGSTERYGNYQSASEAVTRLAKKLAGK